MKRKHSEITKSFDAINKTKKLFIKVPEYLFCDVCRIPVYLYENCVGNDVYCGRDCYEILQLSKKNDLLDLKTTPKFENLMELDTK